MLKYSYIRRRNASGGNRLVVSSLLVFFLLIAGPVQAEVCTRYSISAGPVRICSIDFPDGEGEIYGEFTFSPNRYLVPESSRVKVDYHPQSKFARGRYLDVSVSRQVMTLFEDGRETNQFLVSTGRYGMPTPLGTFSVKRKEVKHWSSSYRLWMPYSLNFTGPYYVHELPVWPNGYHEPPTHLGQRVSHGCVRLGVGPAEYVYGWAEVGTLIYVHK